LGLLVINSRARGCGRTKWGRFEVDYWLTYETYGLKAGERADMSGEKLNIMARSNIEKDYGTFRWIMNLRTELTTPTGAQGGGRTGYERTNAKYNGANRYEVILRYILRRLFAHVRDYEKILSK
jgi:hypothetical protein